MYSGAEADMDQVGRNIGKLLRLLTIPAVRRHFKRAKHNKLALSLGVFGVWGFTFLVLEAWGTQSPILSLFTILGIGVLGVDALKGGLSQKIAQRISVRDLDELRKIKKIYKPHDQTGELSIGVSAVDQSVVGLSDNERKMHLLCVGSTGCGKTTLMQNMIANGAVRGFGGVIIDPKGDEEGLSRLKRQVAEAGGDVQKIRVFSLISGEREKELHTYNPLKSGSAMELKDRVMAALTWSEPFYEAVSSEFLSVIFPVLKRIGEPISINAVRKSLDCQKFKGEIIKRLSLGLTTSFDSEGEKELLIEFERVRKLDSKVLMGLSSQLRILDNFELGAKLRSSSREIDLRQIVKDGEIAYFQLPTLSFGDSATRLGKMILEDLKSVTSEIYQKKIPCPEFFPVFIDEFGEFATKSFITWLKQARAANFGISLFCQGLGDLDAVSKEFRSQVLDNTIVKVIMRQDDPDSVEVWSRLCGTVDTQAKSSQVESGLFGLRDTGMGNLRDTKEMRVEHDVFKRLNIGEAVLIQRSPCRENLLKLFN